MIKFNMALMKEAKSLFPDATDLHEMMRTGNRKSLDYVQMKIGFMIDEDDIIRAFRNKKETKLLDMAKRAKAIRELYQKMFFVMEAHDNKTMEKMDMQDCM